MSGVSVSDTETVTYEKVTSVGDDEKGFCGDYDPSTIALFIVAIIIVLIWTAVVWCGVSNSAGCWGKSKRGTHGGKEQLANGFAGFIIWFIVLIIFIAVVWKWRWAGIIAFVIIAIILGFAFWWSCGSCSTRTKTKDDTC